MKEQFEDRKLTGPVNVTCKFDDGSVRYWREDKAIIIGHIIRIVNQYSRMNYRLTLRQLHYQFVGHVPGYVNHTTAYKKLGTILDDCRYGGVIDWSAIIDRGRVPHIPYCVEDPKDALQDAIDTYRIDRQIGQETHVEVWTEKDALSEIIQRSTSKYHIRCCVNKGYTSSSAIYEAYNRFKDIIDEQKNVVVLYIGDHDPSGLDMVRDVDERLKFMLTNGENVSSYYADSITVIPICLNIEQVKKYKLPPNPTKITDTRSDNYIKIYGKTCWEVDALDAPVLTQIIESNIEANISMSQYRKQIKEENEGRDTLKRIVKGLK